MGLLRGSHGEQEQNQVPVLRGDFTVDVRNRGRQKYCPKPACRAAAKAARQRRWREHFIDMHSIRCQVIKKCLYTVATSILSGLGLSSSVPP
jgi:hypothetical protein